jgi:hypothetical protein
MFFLSYSTSGPGPGGDPYQDNGHADPDDKIRCGKWFRLPADLYERDNAGNNNDDGQRQRNSYGQFHDCLVSLSNHFAISPSSQFLLYFNASRDNGLPPVKPGFLQSRMI